MYVGPLLVGLGVTVQSSDWELGYFTRVAQIVSLKCCRVVSRPLKAVTSAASKVLDETDNKCAR